MKLLFLIIYFIILIALGLYSFFRIKKSDDFYIAGGNNNIIGVSGSLLATILGSAAILGTVNLSFTKGWASSWWILCGVIGLLILLPLSKLVKRYGKFTLPQMLGDFYGKPAEIGSSIIIPFAWIGIVAAQIIGSAKILYSFFSLPYHYGVIISGIVFICYTILGGQISIIKTDVVQILFIISGLIVMMIFSLNILNYNIGNLTELKFPFNEAFKPFDLVILFLTLSTTYFVGPDIYSRLFCAKDEKTAFKSVLIAIIILIPLAFGISFLGVYARSVLNIDIKNTTALLVLAHNILPVWAVGLMTAALLSAVMSSADTTLLTASTIISELFTDISQKKSIIITRIFIFVIGALSILIALIFKSIIGTLLLSLTIFSGAFIVPVIAGLFKYRVNKLQSLLAMILGGTVALLGKIINIFFKINNGKIIENVIIISAFIINAVILFLPVKVKDDKEG